MRNTKKILNKLNISKINGFRFKKKLGGGSSLTCLYVKNKEKIVLKILISPRNKQELERFQFEYSVLEKNYANHLPGIDDEFTLSRVFNGPKTSYPLPKIAVKLKQKLGGLVTYFGYFYQEGTLLSNKIKSLKTYEEKIKILHRIASGLNYFYRVGYSHRDLHPENILLLENHQMFDVDKTGKENDPRVIFLDMGNCQIENPDHQFFKIERKINEKEINEEEIITENNKRLLSSFTSMPPDFLEKGGQTKNYDSWAFGIFAYQILFGKIPFKLSEIIDVRNLKIEENKEFHENINTLPAGLKLIIKHLLATNGDTRPTIHAIVRLFHFLIYRKEESENSEKMKRIIHNNGIDPDLDPLDMIY